MERAARRKKSRSSTAAVAQAQRMSLEAARLHDASMHLVKRREKKDCKAAPFCIRWMLKVSGELGEKWLQCDRCELWYHFICEGYFLADEVKQVGGDDYICRR